MLRRFAWGILAPLIGACTLFTSLDGTSGGERPSTSLEAGSEPSLAGDGDAPRNDTDVDTAPDAGCVRRPVLVVDATPVGSNGFTCDLGNASEVDGKLAGLDSNSGPSGMVGTEKVTSCFEARFDADIGARVVVHAQAKMSACGGGCTGGCEGSPQLKIFAGASATTLEYLGLVTVDADAGVEPYTVFRKSIEPARTVFVCRVASSYVDPVVDAVAAYCP